MAPQKKSTFIAVDGVLGPKTIRKWQEVMGVKVDGRLTAGEGGLVRAVQQKLHDTVDHRVKVDGKGLAQDGERSNTIGALQRYLKAPVDEFLTPDKSRTVVALQRRLNEGWF